MARRMHAHGMRVSVYVGGTLFSDSFFREVPAARGWCRVTQDGKPILYSSFQVERYFACLNNAEYRGYLHRVLDVAIDEVQTDEIFFDNQILRAEPRSCRCETCVGAFREFLRKKYDEATRLERYGQSDVSDVTPPLWDQASPPWAAREIRNPVIQDWIDFRCQTVLDFYTDMVNHIRGKNPKVCVGINIKGIHGHNRAFDHGIDHGRFKDLGDFFALDAGRFERMASNGAMVSEIRSYKVTHTIGMATSQARDDRSLVAYMMFNKPRHVPGFGYFGGMDRVRMFSPYAQFFRAHEKEFFFDQDQVADVAVLRSFASTAYNCLDVHRSLMNVEEGLIRHHVPFTIIFDQNMDALSRYRVLLLVDQESLSQVNLDAVDAFLRAGGGVVTTEATATYNDWRRPYVEHPFVRYFGRRPGDQPLRATVGQGRIAYIPRVKCKIDGKYGVMEYPWLGADEAFVPVNWAEIAGAIRYAAGAPLSVALQAPSTVAMEYWTGPKEHQRSLHLLNFVDRPTGKAVKVTVPLKGPKAKLSVELLSPEWPKGKPARVSYRGGLASFGVPSFKLYAAAVVRFPS
jgi:hypothetical protein